ncbi:MAG: septal ring lytic transglycosylase RlpA family protein [Spirochaetota bacterium]
MLTAIFLVCMLSSFSLYGQQTPLTAPQTASTESLPQAQPVAPGFSFEGRASWYGIDFQGRPTANGELFDRAGLTAAHRSLPFGTLLRVTARSSGASAVVRVNDRGPFVGDRVIDLSEAAARLIGLVAEGTGWVSCVVLSPADAAAFGTPLPPDQGPGTTVAPQTRNCRVQVASYRDAKNAEATLERLRLSGIKAAIEVAGSYRRIVLAMVPGSELAELTSRLSALGYRDLLVTWLP